jgi:hypothetical protein
MVETETGRAATEYNEAQPARHGQRQTCYMTAAVDVFLVSRFLLIVSRFLLPVSRSLACFEKVVRNHHSLPFPCRVTRAYMTRVSWPLALALSA